MLHNLFRATVFAASIMSVGGVYFAAPAYAEMVFNRGNSADPESLDPHKTSTVYEANILRDLFEGLVM
ncbi:MAG: peptide ABC transporter substrate-binding protein, partial [Rhizobiaceae bacterium]|nr:peptide ABC transporter substrate-binding protein [Rhizobiaceae bacterium]